MRLKLFVHSLILALCSTGTVLAAKDSQTDIGAAIDDVVTIGVTSQSVAGAHENIFQSDQDPGQKRHVFLAAATAKDKSQPVSSGLSDKAKYGSFQELDVQAENILREVLDLSSDLAIIDEQHVNPPKNQLLVLVTLQATKFFELDYVELTIDNQVVAAHPYDEKDIAAMVRGGGHRLYLTNLPAGTHELKAKFAGKVPRDPDYQREATFKFISGVNRTLIELYINSGDNSGFPQFTVREWN